MIELKDWIYYGLSLLGIIITGIFSYLVWVATKKSTSMAEASYELSKTISDGENKRNLKMRQTYILWMERRIGKIVSALYEQKDKLDYASINNAPKDIGLSNEVFATYFTLEEQTTLYTIFDMFNNHIEKYWFDKGELIHGMVNPLYHDYMRESIELMELINDYADELDFINKAVSS